MKILFVGLSGVPYSKRACDIRLTSFANLFTQNGHIVWILNRYKTAIDTSSNGNHSDSRFKIIELSNSTKQQTKFQYLINAALSYLREFRWLIKQNRKDSIDILHLYSGHYFEFLHYYLISRLIKAKVVYQYVEVRSSMDRSGVYHKLNGFLCDRFGHRLFDGIISISNFIENTILKRNQKLPTIKVPPICDIRYFDSIGHTQKVVQPYILFCGNAGFEEVIQLIIDAYLLSKSSKTHKLKLILSGSNATKERFSNNENKNIEILSGLPYDELARLYLNASALLIPLRNTIQDIARFPNKICEYTACKGLIITTEVGEIPFYFTDGKSALISKHFCAKEVALKLDLLNEMNPVEISKIKNESYKLCQSFFDAKVYLNELDQFIKKVTEL